jgi:SWI/SNF-related matrix-associated actin-dependent regulator 1 of chromatin subfamily A
MREFEDLPALFPYQEEGAAWLASKTKALLADEMGVGKTAQAIRACDLIAATRILILCPGIARMNWLREFEKFSKRDSASFQVLLSQRPPTSTSTGLICSYDLLTSSAINTWLQPQRWDVVIADESHYCNGVDTLRTRAVLGRRGVIHRTRRFWALSGTPCRNHSGELWSLLYVCGISQLSHDEFMDRYCRTIDTPYGAKVVGNKNEGEYRALLRNFMLRRRKEDVLKDLPPIQFVDHTIEAAPVDCFRWYHEVTMGWKKDAEIQAKVSEELYSMQKAIELIGKTEDGPQALAGLGPQVEFSRRYVGLSKVPTVVQIVKEELDAKAYEKIILFAYHRDVLHFLRDSFVAYGPLLLFGGTPPIKRDQVVRKFQRDSRCRVAVLQVQAAGVAINLTAASEVAFVEASWVPADNAQAVMRAHRIGQEKPVRVRFFNIANSVDEQIHRVLRRKTKDLVSVFDTPAQDGPAKVVINPFE